MENQLREIVYSRDTIEFVTVAVQYCGYLESFEDVSEAELIDKLTKLLPLLYLKAALVPETDIINEEEEPEITVTEGDIIIFLQSYMMYFRIMMRILKFFFRI